MKLHVSVAKSQFPAFCAPFPFGNMLFLYSLLWFHRARNFNPPKTLLLLRRKMFSDFIWLCFPEAHHPSATWESKLFRSQPRSTSSSSSSSGTVIVTFARFVYRLAPFRWGALLDLLRPPGKISARPSVDGAW